MAQVLTLLSPWGRELPRLGGAGPPSAAAGAWKPRLEGGVRAGAGENTARVCRGLGGRRSVGMGAPSRWPMSPGNRDTS